MVILIIQKTDYVHVFTVDINGMIFRPEETWAKMVLNGNCLDNVLRYPTFEIIWLEKL